MRILAVYCGAFSAGIFLAQYLLPESWLLPCAVLALALACTRPLVPGNAGRRLLLAGTGLALAFGWNWLFIQWTAVPARALDQRVEAVEMILYDYPEPASYGTRATVKIKGVPGLAVYYGDWSLSGLTPGQMVRDTVRLRDAVYVKGDALTTFTSRGVFLLADSRGAVSAGEGTASSCRWWPLRLGHQAEGVLRKLLPGDTAALLTALLTGERSGLSVQAANDIEEAGLSHVLAVSGMHCGFLLAGLALIVGRYRRKTLALCAVPLLVFYALLTGGRPSVVRACIMLFFLLAAPLFRRESDSPTALAAALFLILLRNPFAAASVSLQLSFASVSGILWLSPGLYCLLAGERVPDDATQPETGGKSPDGVLSSLRNTLKRRIRSLIAGSLSVSLGALAFTTPLTGYYFGTLPLIAPISGILCLWAVGGAFITGLVALVIGFWVPSLGRLAALVPALLLRYILAAAHILAHLPGHAVYFANPFLKYWLVYVYLLLAVLWLRNRRRGRGNLQRSAREGSSLKETAFAAGGTSRREAAFAAGLLALSLFCTVRLYQAKFRSGFHVVMLDVGQGQSILLASDGQFALADCGSANSWYDPGTHAARILQSIGCHELDCLLLTHFDADHSNGISSLLSHLRVETLLAPEANEDKEGENRKREEILSLAEQYGVPVYSPAEREELPFGEGTLTIFPPLGTSGDNDRGLSLLASVGETDFLITGDMGQAVEKKLLSAFPLPDLEGMAAGHHGSRTSTSAALLDALTPETVCISVGSNSYGHPAQDTLDRLAERGCTVYRTDLDGDIHLVLEGKRHGQP